MGFGEFIKDYIEKRQDNKRKSASGSLGQFWRDGGNALLYNLPVTTGGVVMDAGGYEGNWTAEMISLYGCRSEIFEPIPEFAIELEKRFRYNSLVNVYDKALGGSSRKAYFSVNEDASSEYYEDTADVIEVDVLDIRDYLDESVDASIDCLKLNIEGGEYEVLETILANNLTGRFKSILVQFHPTVSDYQDRLTEIREGLKDSHKLEWCYEMVWEKWVKS